MAKGKGRRGPSGRAPKLSKEPDVDKNDIFEVEDSDAQEDKLAGKRYDLVDNYEYELPSNFEDEEIDEDEAFNSEDERMYGHLFQSRPETDASNEDDSDSDEADASSDDLLTSDEDLGAQDSEEESLDDENRQDELDHMFADVEDAASSGSDDGSDPGDDDMKNQKHVGHWFDDARSGHDSDDDAHKAMLQAVTGRKAQRRRHDQVVTEAYPESEFNLAVAGPEGELTLTDLIAGLGENRAKLGSARKTLERLERRGAPVEPPLPGPIRARQERKAGYEAAKQDVSKWVPLVKANREAPTLHFKSDVAAVPRTVTTASLAAKHEPETQMEAEVAALLRAAGAHTATAVAEAEEALAMKELTVAEARERRERLAKMRALLFYHEMKAKRLKKIKSKDYRRRLKKAERARAAGQQAGDDGGLLLDEDAMRIQREEAELERAKERLTLKHKNTSRFIRRALRRGQNVMDEGTREAVAEQLRLGQELRAKVHRLGRAGAGSGSDTAASDDVAGTSSDDSEMDDELGKERKQLGGRTTSKKVRAAAFELLQGKQDDGVDAAMANKGLFALPFMQRAMERRRIQAQEEARAALDLPDIEEEKGAGGRLQFGGGVDQSQRLAERVRKLEEAALASDSGLESDEDEDVEAKAQRLRDAITAAPPDEGRANGALEAVARRQAAGIAKRDALFVEPSRACSKNSALEVDFEVDNNTNNQKAMKNSTPATRASQQQQQQQQVSIGPASNGGMVEAEAKVAELEGQASFIPARKFNGAKAGFAFKKGPQGLGYYADQPPKQKRSRNNKTKSSVAANPNGDSDAFGANKQPYDDILMRPSSDTGAPAPGGLSQEELVRRAFAGDNVAEEFAAEKAAEVDAELPDVEVPGAMPGWGTWASQQREPRWAVEAKARAEAKRRSAAASRKDAGLQAVVITEKWDRRNSKYRTPTVPYPYDSKDTYERTMRQPMGREYNTDAAFRNLTRPAVIKDAGVIIQPIRYSAAMAEHASKAEKGAKRAPVLTVAGGMPKKAKKIR